MKLRSFAVRFLMVVVGLFVFLLGYRAVATPQSGDARHVPYATGVLTGSVVEGTEDGTITVTVVESLPAPPKELSLDELQEIANQPAKKNAGPGTRIIPEMLPLFLEKEINYTGKNKYKNTTLKYRLHVPAKMEPGKKYPLILWLHGVGEAGNNNLDQLVHLHHNITYLTGPKQREFFLLVPQTPSDHTGWDAYSHLREVDDKKADGKGGVITRTYTEVMPDGTQKTITQKFVETDGEPFADSPLGFSFAMLDQVMQEYPVDSDRITVSGLSTGGDGTWRALERRPDLFAAAVPLVSWVALKETAIQKSPVLKKIPIWAIYSSDDRGIENAREDFARVEKEGCNVKKSEFGLCGHNAWTPAMLQGDIFSWLLSRAKKDGEYIQVEDPNVDPDQMRGIVEVAVRDKRTPTLASHPKPTGVITAAPEAAKPMPARAMSVPAPPSAVAPGMPGMSMPGAPVVPSPPLPPMVPQPQMQGQMQSPGMPAVGMTPPGGMGTGMMQPPGMPGMPMQCMMMGGGGMCGKCEMCKGMSMMPQLGMGGQPSPKDRVYAKLVLYYFEIGMYEDVERNFVKVRPPLQGMILESLFDLNEEMSPEQLQLLEKLADRLPDGSPTFVPHMMPPMSGKPLSPRGPAIVYHPFVEHEGTVQPAKEDQTSSATGRYTVEECDKEWEMSSTTQYGLFPAGWDKEADLVPKFVHQSDWREIVQIVSESALKDGKKFNAVCDSVLKLENRPLSSPWFTTSGGRLQSDIKYSLSEKGKALYKTCEMLSKSSVSGEVKNKAAAVIEKMDTILAQ